MPRNRVRTTYTRAKVTPSRRKRPARAVEVHPDFIPELKTPTGLSPLAAYIVENEDTGIPVQELIRQFQEYDCDHPEKEKIVTGHKEITTCLSCGLAEVKEVKR